MIRRPTPRANAHQGNLLGGTHRTAAQFTWMHLFNVPRAHQHLHDEHPNRLTVAQVQPRQQNLLPLVGGDYDFIVPQAWPDDVVHVARNLFSASRPYPVMTTPAYNDEPCNCEPCCVSSTGTHLTSACVNANTATICDGFNCLLGPDCGNRFEPRFSLDLVESRVGLGVVSTQRIPRGAFIIEYVGEILYEDDAVERENRRYQAAFRTQADWNGGSKVYVDALSAGNESRFLNHSCEPNCVMYEFNWTNTTRLGIFAAAEIPPLQELTFRYSARNRELFNCQCLAHAAIAP